MKLEREVVIACLIILIWVQQSDCDELSNTSGISKWTCKCSLYQGDRSYGLKTNCSTSCDCIPDSERSGSTWTWTCTCFDGFPKVASYNLDTNCFTACNCSSGSLSTVQDSRKHISIKEVAIILLLCLVIVTFAFLASAVCFVYRRDKRPRQASMLSSDKESCNSATNLVSLRTSSLLGKKVTADFPLNSSTGCFPKASSLFGSKKGNIHGTIIHFTYSQLESATESFSNSNLIGVGGSSYVYRGWLNGKSVAIKRLKSLGGPDAEFLFLTEIELLSRLHHCHVVPLLGYCSEYLGKSAERLLVFEYMPKGSLRDNLDGVSGKDMGWATRVAIATGAARGLEYLHEAAAPRILHCDVKSTNILLDDSWTAKITDLGMAKCLRADGVPSCSNSPAKMQGTFGYFAPEYAIVGKPSLKSDVFSFGVVLLELISGRRPIYKSTSKGEESLVIWATPRLQDSRRVISDLPDPRLNGNFPEEEMQIMAYLAKECLLLDPDDRPTMSEVVQILLTIAPAQSRRRNRPVYVYQRSSPHRMKSESYIQRSRSQVEKRPGQSSKRSAQCSVQLSGPIDIEDIRPASSSKESTPCSLAVDIDSTLPVGNNGKQAMVHIDRALPVGNKSKEAAVDIDSTMLAENNNKEAGTASVEYMERLILLTSNSRNQRALDDETVDLTEPRLESFCVKNY